MDLIQNTTTGKYFVTLGGVLWNNCTTDADCPGRAICAVNQTWSQFPKLCHCEFTVPQTGATCEQCKLILLSIYIFFFGKSRH